MPAQELTGKFVMYVQYRDSISGFFRPTQSHEYHTSSLGSYIHLYLTSRIVPSTHVWEETKLILYRRSAAAPNSCQALFDILW